MDSGEAASDSWSGAPGLRLMRSVPVPVPVPPDSGPCDAETGLLTPGLFADRLVHALARSQRRPSRLALLLLRIEQAEAVAAQREPAQHSEIVRAAAAALRSLIRRSDTLARLPGADFAILLEEPRGVDDVRQICAGLMMALGGTRVLGSGGKPGTGGLRASIGVALHPCSGRTSRALLRCAARARDEALRSGGARYVIASSGVSAFSRV